MIKQWGRYFHVGRQPLRKTYGYAGNVVHQYMSLLRAEGDRINRQTYYVGDYEPTACNNGLMHFRRNYMSFNSDATDFGSTNWAWCGDVLNKPWHRVIRFTHSGLTTYLPNTSLILLLQSKYVAICRTPRNKAFKRQSTGWLEMFFRKVDNPYLSMFPQHIF